MHGAFTKDSIEVLERIDKPFIVTISHKQRQFAPQLNHIATVYNGIDFTNYPFSAKHEGYLLFLGRISEEKGTHIAIKVAKEANLPLIIAAKLDTHDVRYYKKYVKPHLGGKIQWIGEVGERERNQLYAKALCLLHPVTWPEPFGLTLIEAMACGSPVIAFNKGSIPEVVSHEKTGFVVNNLKEMVESVAKIKLISREECAIHARTNFNAERMIASYESLYSSLLKLLQPEKVYPLPTSQVSTRILRSHKAPFLKQ